jgi:hypothetical protein
VPVGAFSVCSDRFPIWISWSRTRGSEGTGPLFPIDWRPVRRAGPDLAFFLPFLRIADSARPLSQFNGVAAYGRLETHGRSRSSLWARVCVWPRIAENARRLQATFN